MNNDVSPHTTLASWAAAIHQALQAHQVDADALFCKLGFDLQQLTDPNGRYPVSAMTELWQNAIELTDNPAFALVVPRYVQPSTLHGLGLAALASQSIRDAARRLQRFSHIVSDAADVQVHDEQGQTLVRMELIPTCVTSHAAFEAFLANIVQMSRLMLQAPDMAPSIVELRSRQPLDVTPYTDMFACPVHFGADRWALHITRATFDQPVRAANEMLATANDQVVEAYLARFNNDIARKTRLAIIEQLAAGVPSLEEVANRLHLSARSLQRQLSETGYSFSDLREAVQREMAEQWLAQSERSLAEITFRLGFSDQSNFSKAFKRWTGKSPGQYRNATVERAG